MAEETTGSVSATGEEMLGGAAGIVPQDKIDAIKEKAKGGQPGAAVITPVQTEAEKATAAAEAAKGAVAPAVTQPAKPIVVETPLGRQVFGAPGGEVKLTSFADVQAYAKDTFNFEIKDVNDFQVFFKTLNETQAKAAEADKYRIAATNFETTLKNLPEDVGMLFNAAVMGTDYKDLLQQLAEGQKYNYEKAFDAYPELDMVNAFSGKQFTKVEYDALEPDQRSIYKDLSKVKYETARQTFTRTQQETQRATEAQTKSWTDSVESSIAQLRTAYPNMDNNQTERVRQIMTQGLRDSLYNADGTYRQDAAVKIAMQEFGVQTIQTQAKTIGELVEQYRNQGESQATEQILQRSDKPEAGQGGTAQDRKNLISEVVKKQTSFLNAR